MTWIQEHRKDLASLRPNREDIFAKGKKIALAPAFEEARMKCPLGNQGCEFIGSCNGDECRLMSLASEF